MGSVLETKYLVSCMIEEIILRHFVLLISAYFLSSYEQVIDLKMFTYTKLTPGVLKY